MYHQTSRRLLTFLHVGLLESADESKKILSLVLVADVFFDDDNSVNTLNSLGHLLDGTDMHILSLDGVAGHACSGGLRRRRRKRKMGVRLIEV